MNSCFILLSSTWISLFLMNMAIAEQTDLLQMEPGFVGGQIGAVVEEVSLIEEQEVTEVVIYLPDVTPPITEVKLVSRNGKPIPQKKRYKVINDLEGGRTGIVLYMGKKHNVPFKLNYETSDEAPQ